MGPTTTARVVLAAVLLTLVVTRADAQQLAGSFEQLRVLVKPGEKIRVIDRAGQEVRGTVAELSSSSLALVVAGERRQFVESDIDAIRARRADPLANGTKWGLAVGGGFGLLVGISFAAEVGDSGAVIPVFALIYGGLGAGVGAGIDALISGDHIIFARSGSSAKVAVRPILTPGRAGVRASVTF
jgi:hypothetical protein